MILRQTDNLSRSLQATDISAVDGQHLAQCVVNTLKKDQNDDSFDMFWRKILSQKDLLDVEDPILPRKKKMPARYSDNSNYSFPESPKALYRKIYFEVYDFVINAIDSRFNQKDYGIYRNVQELFLKSVRNECVDKEFTEVVSFNEGDLTPYDLRTQFKLLYSVVNEAKFDTTTFTIQDLFTLIRSFKKPEKELLSQVVILTKLLIVAPATNAVSERSFSSLKRLRTYMRSTTCDDRLNHLMILHVHKEKTDRLDMKNVARRFVSKQGVRKVLFGKI